MLWPSDLQSRSSEGTINFSLNARIYIAIISCTFEENPEIEEMLKRYRTSLELTNEVLAYMKKNAVTPKDAAEWFLKSHPKLWRSWIADPKVQEKIARSLEQI